jgi:hypothetical protein
MHVRDLSLWLLKRFVRLLAAIADLLGSEGSAAAHGRRTGVPAPAVPAPWVAQVHALQDQTAQLDDEADALQVADVLQTAVLLFEELRTFYLSQQQAGDEATQALNFLRLILPAVFQIYLREGDSKVMATVLPLLIILDRRMAEAGSEATYEQRLLRWGSATVAAIGGDDRADAVAAVLSLTMVLLSFLAHKLIAPKAPWLRTAPDDWRPVFRFGFDGVEGDFPPAERHALSRALTTYFTPRYEAFLDEAAFKTLPPIPTPWSAGGPSLTILPVPAQPPVHGGAVALYAEGDFRREETSANGRHRFEADIEPGAAVVIPVAEPLLGGGNPALRARVAYVYTKPDDGRSEPAGVTIKLDELRVEAVIEAAAQMPALVATAAMRGLTLSAGGFLPFRGRTDLVLRYDTRTNRLSFEGGLGLELRKRIAVGSVKDEQDQPTGDAYVDAVLLARLAASQRETEGLQASVELLADVTLRIGRAITVAAAGSGVRLTLRSADDGSANLAGLYAAAMTPVPPSGIGLTAAIGPVTGGGMLRVTPERVSGVVELSLGRAFRLTGIGQYTSRRQWLALVSFERETPGPLFVPQGVGVLLARGRRADAEAIRASLGTGELELVLMPRDVVANEARIMAALDRFFPPGASMLIGVIVRFRSRGGTFDARIGVIADIPEHDGLALHLLAVAAIQVPSQKPWALDGAGLWDTARGEGYLRLQLRDARLWGFEVTGSLAVFHGDPDGDGPVGKGTWVALGGFFPGYPAPGPALQGLARMGVVWRQGDHVRLTIQGYLAWTPASLQFGIAADFVARYAGFGFDGGLSFDALVAFDWSCQIDFHAHLRFQVLGRTLAGFAVDCTYTATDRYRLCGAAHYEFLWFSGTKHFSCDLGARDAPRLPPGEVEQALAAELGRTEAWRPATARAVVLSGRERGIVLPPDGRTYVEQAIVPLDVVIDLFGTQRLASPRAFTVSLAAGPARSARLGEFAPGMFFELTQDEALRVPVAVQHDCGLELQWPMRSGSGRDVDDDWEEIVVDPQYVPPATPAKLLLRAVLMTPTGTAAMPKPVVVHAQAFRLPTGGQPVTWMHARAALIAAPAPPPPGAIFAVAAPPPPPARARLTEAWR